MGVAVTRIVAAGDSALVLEFDEVIAPEISARTIAASRAIAARQLVGVRDIVPAYRSVTVYFDPLRADWEQLDEALYEASEISVAAPMTSGREVRIPVCYGGACGPDLAEVAAFADLDERDVILRHSGRPYHVFLIGFTPGFAYMGVVDERLAAPRHATPRVRVPAGSVGIAGRQTGVYPRETPGGWRLIGRTPTTLFDARREEPSLLAPGDRVRFEPIEHRDFLRLSGGMS